MLSEELLVEFLGSAFSRQEVSIEALSQSLDALHGIVRRAAEAAYGREADLAFRIEPGLKSSSYILHILVENQEEKGLRTVSVLNDIFQIVRWACGKKVKIKTAQTKRSDGKIIVANEEGKIALFDQYIITMYNAPRTMSLFSRFTQTLDTEGAEGIYISGEEIQEYKISKKERVYFRQCDGVIVSDNEIEQVLTIASPQLDGTPSGWTFCEGSSGLKFSATVEDEFFLEDVRNKKYLFSNGSSIRALVRIVQKQDAVVTTDRYIVEVRKVY